MDKRKQFTFYRSFMNALEDVPEEFRWPAVRAVIEYGLDGKKPQGLDSHGKIYFKMAKPTLDAGRKKAKAGKEGGSKTQANRKQAASKKENEIEKEIENEIETENEDERQARSRAFESFWEKYPVKIDPKGAQAEFLRCEEEPQRIMEALERWLQCSQWRSDGGRFIPKASKWLGEKRFLQELPGSTPCGATGELGQAELEAIQRMMMEG